jgi:hypothetical protein
MITAIRESSSARLTPDEYKTNADRRVLISALSIVAINLIVLPTILWWVWIGFTVQTIGIIFIIVWQEFENRRDRNRTDWGEVAEVQSRRVSTSDTNP